MRKQNRRRKIKQLDDSAPNTVTPPLSSGGSDITECLLLSDSNILNNSTIYDEEVPVKRKIGRPKKIQPIVEMEILKPPSVFADLWEAASDLLNGSRKRKVGRPKKVKSLNQSELTSKPEPEQVQILPVKKRKIGRPKKTLNCLNDSQSLPSKTDLNSSQKIDNSSETKQETEEQEQRQLGTDTEQETIAEEQPEPEPCPPAIVLKEAVIQIEKLNSNYMAPSSQTWTPYEVLQNKYRTILKNNLTLQRAVKSTEKKLNELQKEYDLLQQKFAEFKHQNRSKSIQRSVKRSVRKKRLKKLRPAKAGCKKKYTKPKKIDWFYFNI